MKKWMSLVMALIATVSILPQAVAATESEALIKNGSFEEDLTNWGSSNVTIVNPENQEDHGNIEAAHGENYACMESGSALNHNSNDGGFIPVDSPSTYRLSFKLRGDGVNASTVKLQWYARYKNSEGTPTLYEGSAACKTATADDVYARATLHRLSQNYSYQITSKASTEWVDVAYDMPFVSPNVYDAYVRINAVSKVYIDCVEFKKIMDAPNYVLNGSFEAAQETVGTRIKPTSWAMYTNEGLTSTWTEENKNGVMQTGSTNADVLKQNYFLQNLYLPSGRYVLSFKAKALTEAGEIYVGFLNIDGGKDIDNTAYATNPWWRMNAVNNADLRNGYPFDITTEWKTYNLYFTMPEKTATDEPWFMELRMPCPGSTASSVACMIDDVMLVPDKTTVSYCDATGAVDTSGKNILMQKMQDYTDLQSIGAGKNLKAVVHYVPKTDGVAETVNFITCLYKKEGEAVRLAEVQLTSGTTGTTTYEGLKQAEDPVSYTGADAGACLTLANEITLPDDLDNTYYAKSFFIDIENVRTEGITEIKYQGE